MIRHRVTVSAATSLVLLIGLVMFVRSAQGADGPVHAEAVMLHIGGEGERVGLAMELWDQHARFLIIPIGDEWDVDEQWCGTDDHIICRPIHPETTLGEARLLGGLTDEFGWQEVATVTTDYHVRRAGILDRRCTDADIVAYGAENDLGLLALAGKYLHEIGGLALTLFQSCST